jgi:acyl-CoA hydrolase
MQNHSYKTVSPAQAIQLVQSGHSVVVSHASGEARHFYEQIHKHARSLVQTTVYGANPSKNYPCFSEAGLNGHLNFDLTFLNSSVRQARKMDHVHYVPSHMSRWAHHMHSSASRKKQLSQANADEAVIDIFWGSCSLPDERGFVSLGLNAVYEAEIIHRAKIIILEMNPHMPFTYGSTLFPVSKIDYVVAQNLPPPSHISPAPGPEDIKIGSFVAELVSDESTIQLGIGGIPNAIGQSLAGHRKLGVHTEMINDAIMALKKSGAIDGSSKSLWKDKIIGAFAYGSADLYKFIDKNTEIELHPASIVNDRSTISQNHKMTSINTAVEIDITGQVCSESIGHAEITGTGGASDTHIGAQLSKGGRGIIAMRSTTKDGDRSKIVCGLAPGAKVTIHRNDIDTVVTEYGIAEMIGKNASQRAKSLIEIAHPKFREELLFEAKKFGYL